MKTYLHPQSLEYDGTQLRSHFAYETFRIPGDSIVAFIGACNVNTTELVDLEDVQNGKFIRSEDMLHFIVEHFEHDLEKIIAYQRLLICLIIEEMQESVVGLVLNRKGDDIYDDVFKLSVSIATKSPVSCLIHTGINVSAKNTPVPAKGLDDYALSPKALAVGVMNRYKHEIQTVKWARCKVRGVP